MGRHYYTLKGWKGLTFKGIAITVLGGLLVSPVVTLIVWLFDKDSSPFAIAFFAIALALLGWLAFSELLPNKYRKTFYRDDYYCADCGQWLGYGAAVCGRCGCNRYTTNDPGVGRTVKAR